MAEKRGIMRSIDLNSDLGEGFGPWAMGDDAAMLGLVTSANVACGGHASDPETMFATLRLAAQNGVTVGAHPGYNDREGFGRRIIPMSAPEITRMVAAQIGTLMGLAITVNINEIEQFLARSTGQDIFPRDVYYFDRIPTEIQPMAIALVNLGSVGIAVLFSILPALRAAFLHPVRALRFE
jgi:hypothetical protein